MREGNGVVRKSVLWGWITLSVTWVEVIGWSRWQAIEDRSKPIRLTVVPPSVPPSVTILDGRRSAEWTPEDVEALKPPPENRLFEIRHPLGKPYDRYSAAALALWACCWATTLPTILLLLIGGAKRRPQLKDAQ